MEYYLEDLKNCHTILKKKYKSNKYNQSDFSDIMKQISDLYQTINTFDNKKNKEVLQYNTSDLLFILILYEYYIK